MRLTLSKLTLVNLKKYYKIMLKMLTTVMIALHGLILTYIYVQLHAVSRTQPGGQREPSVKTLRSPLSTNSGGIAC